VGSIDLQLKVSRRIGPVHYTLEEFENGAFTLKTPGIFSVHATPERFENGTMTGHFGSVLEKNSARNISLIS